MSCSVREFTDKTANVFVVNCSPAVFDDNSNNSIFSACPKGKQIVSFRGLAADTTVYEKRMQPV